MEIVETEKRLWGEGNSGFTKESALTRSHHRQRKPQVCFNNTERIRGATGAR